MTTSDLEEKISALADSQLETAEMLKTLLTRDPKKEFGYGPQFDPNVVRRYQSNMFRSLVPIAGGTTPLVNIAPNSVEEITITLSSAADTRNGILLKVEMDVNKEFTNVPADGRDHTIFIPPSVVAVNAFTVGTGVSASFNYAWFERFPCVAKWTRMSLVNPLGVAVVWPACRVGVAFHGQ